MLFQVTLMNVLGMAGAIGGVFMYNVVKYHEKLAKETLPTQNNKTTSLWANGNLGRYSMPLWRKLTETIETCAWQTLKNDGCHPQRRRISLQNANGSADARVKLVSPAEYFSNGYRRL